MTANVEIITGVKANVLRVPTNSLRFRPRAADRPEEKPGKKDDMPKPAVYISTAEAYRPGKRTVQLGLQGDEFTEVTSGLKAGEKILVRTKSLKPKATTDEGAEDDVDAAS
jgi:HlyD family secretion protein